MESFAKHAGRTTVTTEDVMLLTRRNEGLEAVLRAVLEEQRREKGEAGAKKRRGWNLDDGNEEALLN